MKNHPDSLLRFMFEHAPIRGERVHLDETWRNVLALHDYPPQMRLLMGELCAAAVLLAATLKLDGSLILQIQGQGAIQLLVVECTGDLKVRATAKWDGEITGSLQELVGNGRFVITLAPKNGKQTYQGIVELEGNTIAKILENYLTRSEQLETRLWLSANDHVAAGMLLQKLPEQEENDADAWTRIIQLASTLQSDELIHLPTVELLYRLYHEEDVRLFEEQTVEFSCTCSRNNVAQMLRMLGTEEVASILAERETIEVHCEFCNQRYEFDAVDAAVLFAEAAAVTNNETHH